MPRECIPDQLLRNHTHRRIDLQSAEPQAQEATIATKKVDEPFATEKEPIATEKEPLAQEAEKIDPIQEEEDGQEEDDEEEAHQAKAHQEEDDILKQPVSQSASQQAV